MEESHVNVGMKANNNAGSIFSLFNELSGKENENPKFCWALIKSLRGTEFSVGSGSNLDYSIKRLVRKMGSNRLHTQCGCFAALSCVLKYEACSIEIVLEALEKEQKPPPGATKSEMKTLVTGCVLTCGAIIHSGLFSGQPKEVQTKIVQKLYESGKKKSYLLPVACQFLIDAVNSINDDEFQNVVWPICQCGFFQNVSDCDADTFSLLLSCLNKNYKVVNKFLHHNSISSDLLIENIVKCLHSSTVKCDHSIYIGLAQFLCNNVTLPVKFWTRFVNESTNANSHKDAVLVTVFSCIIKNLQEATFIPQLLVPKFIEAVIKMMTTRKTKLKEDCRSKAKSALNSMIGLLSSESTSDETRFQSIKKLLFYPANLKFELKTGTKCIYTLVSKLSSDFIKNFINIYKQVVIDEVKKQIDDNGTKENWNSKEKQYALYVFTKTLNHPSMKKEIHWKLNEIKFIFEIGFLEKYNLPSDVQKCAKDCFYKAVMVQMPSFKELILFLNELALFVNDKIADQELKANEEIKDLWNRMYSTVEMLKKKLDNKPYTAVHVLLIYMGLYLFVDCKLAKGGIEELLLCYKHLKESQKKKNSEDESVPHWTEVTVDLILSLLSRENRLWRQVVSYVFPQVVSQITPTALQQIIDVLDPKVQSSSVLRHGDSDDDDDGDDDDYDDDDDDDNDNGEEEDEEENNEESESSLTEAEENDTEGKSNDQLRLAVRNALGYSAACTDDESVDMDDMDEEEERRVNESLSEAFRQFKKKSQTNKKKQTKEEEAVTHFRLRVLDLVEIYINNSPSMGGILDLLLPLFELLEFSIKNLHQRPLQNRVDSILKHLSVIKTFSNTDNVNQAIIKEVFQSVISRKERTTLVFVEMSPRISDCTAFLVRCSQQIPNKGTEIPLIDEYDSLLKSFFQSRDSKLPISTFQAVLRMSWKGNLKMVESLFQLLFSSNVRIFKKVKIIELLRIFYKNDKLHGCSDDSWKSTLNEIETNFVHNFLALLSEHGQNESKTIEKVYLSFFSNVIALINVIQLCCKRHRAEKNFKKKPPWRELVSKMAQTEVIINNKKTRSQLGNLANIFKVELSTSEKPKRRRTVSETLGQTVNEEEEKKESCEKEGKKKKKKKKMSAEKRKLKNESRKLREEISSNGLDIVRFSAVDSMSLPESGLEEEEELSVPKKKRKKNEED